MMATLRLSLKSCLPGPTALSGESMSKKICLTGIKPTGTPHLGNYIGAIKPSLELAANPSHQAYYFIADYHALISIQDPKVLKQYIHEVAATWIALGLDVKKSVLYQQSQIPELFELTWILNCFTAKGLMNRAHAYKALLQKNAEAKKDPDFGVSMGLYDYPVLMAADILFIESDLVPVGADQIQHLEIARDIASTLNHQYKNLLKLPEALVQKTASIVPGLDGRKMSKSYNNYISLFLPSKKLRKSVMKISTDSLPPEAPKDPDQSNIFLLYQHFAKSEEIDAMRKEYQKGISWGVAKEELFKKMEETLAGPREIYNELMANPEKIQAVLDASTERVRPKAREVLKKIKDAIGV